MELIQLRRRGDQSSTKIAIIEKNLWRNIESSVEDKLAPHDLNVTGFSIIRDNSFFSRLSHEVQGCSIVVIVRIEIPPDSFAKLIDHYAIYVILSGSLSQLVNDSSPSFCEFESTSILCDHIDSLVGWVSGFTSATRRSATLSSYTPSPTDLSRPNSGHRSSSQMSSLVNSPVPSPRPDPRSVSPIRVELDSATCAELPTNSTFVHAFNAALDLKEGKTRNTEVPTVPHSTPMTVSFNNTWITIMLDPPIEIIQRSDFRLTRNREFKDACGAHFNYVTFEVSPYPQGQTMQQKIGCPEECLIDLIIPT